MKNLKRFCILTFIFFGSFAAHSQKIKYKDIYSMIRASDVEGALGYLKIYLKSDTSFANANLQMGLIFYDKSKLLDPLKENEASIKLADSAAFYLTRARRQINEKDIKKNDEYYLTYRVNLKDTTKLIDNRDTILRRVFREIDLKKKDILHHKGSIRKISVAFNKSIENYQRASLLYNKLNDRYSSAKELCLLSDESVSAQLVEIKSAFDSAITYLNTYKRLIKEYPIKNYNQNYQVATIETYRIDGFTKTDFLVNQITLWNYGEWAKTMLNAIQSDIKKLKEGILDTDQRYKYLQELIIKGEKPLDSALSTKVDIRLQRLINKYDYNSLALHLLMYKQKRTAYTGFALDRLNAIENTNAANIDLKSSFMFDMIKRARSCDTSLQKLVGINISKQALKYNYYISKAFADTIGLKNYIETEKDFISLHQREARARYNTLMHHYLQKYNDSLAYITYNDLQIPLFKSFGKTRSSVKTTCIKEDKKGNLYLSGIHNSSAFVCKINDKRQVVWFKTFGTKVAGSTFEVASAIETIDESCAVAIGSKSTGGMKTTIVKIDKSGVETASKRMDGNGLARFLIYDEINDGFIVVFKGSSLQDFAESEEQVNVSYFENTGAVKWSQNISLFGTVCDFAKIFEGYLLTCNYATVSAGGGIIASKAGQGITKSNIFLLKISTSGEIRGHETIPSSTPVYAVGVIKVSNNNIQIVGYNGEFTPQHVLRLPDNKGDSMQKTINSNLEFVYY